MRFRFVEAEKALYPIRLMCRCLAVSRSGYYAWRKRLPSVRVQQDARLRVEIAASHTASRRTYGSPRILRDLREGGHRVSRKRVARLMRDLGLEGRRKRRFRATTDSRHRFPVAPNILMREFDVETPNTAWVTDITYLATLEGWLYLAVILDLFSRRVVGYAMSERIDRALVLEALREALVRRPEVLDLVHHSDRGSQGGFKGSSQHLEIGELRWRRAGVDELIMRYVQRCVHPAGRRPAGANIDSGSGRGSLEACRARKREWRPACLPLSGHAGFARVVGWRRLRFVPSRGATYRSSSEKRSLCFMPAATECVRSLAS